MDLVSLAFVIGLSIWARRMSRRPGAPAYVRRIPHVLVGLWITELLCVGVTVGLLVRSFRSIDHVDPSDKARMLAEGISEAMNATFLGMIVFFVPAIVTTVLLVILSRRLQSAE